MSEIARVWRHVPDCKKQYISGLVWRGTARWKRIGPKSTVRFTLRMVDLWRASHRRGNR